MNSAAFDRISRGNEGVLGGPAVFGASQVSSEQASLGVDLPNPVPDAGPSALAATLAMADLSTGTLDGAKIIEKSMVSGAGAGSGGGGLAGDTVSIAAKNQNLLTATAALASGTSQEGAGSRTASRYFIQPTSGYNWGVLHNQNAVDIANSCGTPVVAAAAGTVVSDPSLGSGFSGWNGGYGIFLLIEHPNGMRTRYAHLSKILVSLGEAVEQGQQVGRIGNTGKVHGVTGCHLHFEVMGGANPFVR